jgi:hypothetical protein
MRGGYSFLEKIVFNQELEREGNSCSVLWRS